MPPSTGEGSPEEVVSGGERREEWIHFQHVELEMAVEHSSGEAQMAVALTEFWIYKTIWSAYLFIQEIQI